MEYDEAQNTWSRIEPILNGDGVGSYAGWSIDISNDGKIISVGAPGKSGQNGRSAGQVKIYKISK